MEAQQFMSATARHARPKSEPAPPKVATATPRPTPRGKHARGKHAKPPLARRIVLGVLVLLTVATAGPALIALGMFVGILGAWLSRGLTKH
jgi:hypothetical protein